MLFDVGRNVPFRCHRYCVQVKNINNHTPIKYDASINFVTAGKTEKSFNILVKIATEKARCNVMFNLMNTYSAIMILKHMGNMFRFALTFVLFERCQNG